MQLIKIVKPNCTICYIIFLLLVSIIFIKSEIVVISIFGIILLLSLYLNYIYLQKNVKYSQQLKIQKELYDLVFDNANYGVLMLDTETKKFIDCNAQVVKMLRYQSKDNLFNIHPSELSPKYQPDGQNSKTKANYMIELAIKNGLHSFEWKHLRSSGEEFWVEITLTLVAINNKKILHVIWKDIDDRKKTKLELTNLNRSLNDKIKEAIQKNHEQQKQLLYQSRLAQIGEMISMIAHQWRQPLNILGVINMKLETKLEFENEITAESYKPISKNITQQLSFMSNTIDDFRNFFKPNKSISQTTFSKLIDNTLGIIQASIINNNIKLYQDLNCDTILNIYDTEVMQVILNIIKNAEDILLDKKIKNPYIHLKSYNKDKDNKAILEIRDNAGGVPIDIIEKIFDPYFSTKKDKNGTGLGLYMSKIIIEEHCHGKLTVTNQKNEAVFKIIL